MRTTPAPAGRRASSGRNAGSQSPGIARRTGRALGGFALRRPGVVLTVVAALGGTAVFSWNALTQQPTRHPAPLFATAKGDPARVEPPRRPADSAPAPKPRADAPAPAATPPEKLAAAKPAASDPIGDLIRAADAPARPGELPKPETARVAALQKALTKLGYGPLKPDGVMGTTTRQALEKFERDRNLPVTTGGLGPRTAKQIATLSGVPVE